MSRSRHTEAQMGSSYRGKWSHTTEATRNLDRYNSTTTAGLSCIHCAGPAKLHLLATFRMNVTAVQPRFGSANSRRHPYKDPGRHRARQLYGPWDIKISTFGDSAWRSETKG
jgi:hypothetical protein